MNNMASRLLRYQYYFYYCLMNITITNAFKSTMTGSTKSEKKWKFKAFTKTIPKPFRLRHSVPYFHKQKENVHLAQFHPQDFPLNAFLIWNVFLSHLYQFKLELCFKAQLEYHTSNRVFINLLFLGTPKAIIECTVQHLYSVTYFSTLFNKYYFFLN